MAAEMAELKICRYPGNTRSKVWKYFDFYQVKVRAQNKGKLEYDKGNL